MLSELEFKKNQELRIDKIISIALMSSFIVLTFQYLILTTFNLLGTPTASLVQTGSKVVVGFIFVIALPYVLKRKLKLFVIIYGLAIIIFGYNFLVFPENYSYLMNIVFPFFFMALPSFIYMLSLNNLMVFEKIVEKTAFLIFIFGAVLGILLFTGIASAGAYSMPLSYYMLLPALIFLGKLFDKGHWIFIIFFAVALTVILALGSRGALLCIAVYMILRVISPKQKLSAAKLIAYGSSAIIIVLGITNLERVLLFLNRSFLEFGIQSRTIRLLLEDAIYLSGRDNISEIVMSSIYQSPFLGIGIAGDTRVLGNSYVHNFFMEVLGNFGFPFGIFLISILLIVLIITLSLSNYYNLIVLWMSLGFVHLMVSSSYITDIKFWIFLGVLLSAFKKLTKKNKEKINLGGEN